MLQKNQNLHPHASEESEAESTCFRRIRTCIRMFQKNKSHNLPFCFSADLAFIHGAGVPSLFHHRGYFLFKQWMPHSVE
ncbi:hypothetical protein NPIL_686751 [Nephila pilipes]|uniref:Uncharacterized protein n=1 Tax=Nephila pilipes TaxID=299642 RepID=A0A8X6TW57_NEPPI|nr:hypothetical protein NPIL_686751 [Nephila pilipes]